MKTPRLVLLLTLAAAAVLPGCKSAKRTTPQWYLHQIEGPFASLDQYCQRFSSVAGSCDFEDVKTPVPAPFDDFRAIRFARVRAHQQLKIDWLVLVITTDKGLFVADRPMYEFGGIAGGNATVVAVERMPTPSGRARVSVTLRGSGGTPTFSGVEDRARFIRADGSYDVRVVCDSDDGVVRCLDPGVTLLD